MHNLNIDSDKDLLHKLPRILLVEDNELNRDMLSRGLRRKDYDVVVAAGGKQALDEVAEEKPDLILMDLSLPEIDGLEATRRLKANNATRCIPIIALTTYGENTDRYGAFEAGCDDYDVKPIDFTRLLSKIKGQLGKGLKAK